MSSKKHFESVMRAWFEVVMSRSTEDFVRFLKERELNYAQYGALMRLYHHGNCAVSDLGNQFGISAPAASQLVEKLVQQHLVERTGDLHDRRVKQLALTDVGRALVKNSFEARLKWALTLGELLPTERLDATAQALADLIAAAQALEQPVV